MRVLPTNVPFFTKPQKEVIVMEVVRKQILRVIYIFMLLYNVFFFLRFFLRLFGADPANIFAFFIFVVSSFFMLPFIGIFPHYRDDILAGQMTVDFSAVTAGFCYNILLTLTIIVIHIITKMMRTERQAKESIEKSKPINTQPVDITFPRHT